MKFYNNIFASAYKCYDKYENSARYRAVSFVVIHLFGFFMLILSSFKRLFALDFSKYSIYKLSFLIVGLCFLGLGRKYYSKAKIENILLGFDQKTIRERKFWGFIAVITFILEYVTFAFLLSK